MRIRVNHKRSKLVATSGTPTQCVNCAVRERALFQGIPPEQLKWTQTYRENQYRIEARSQLFEEGEDHPFAYTLYSGWMMLTKSSTGGRRQVLRFALPGDFIGFQANLRGNMSYGAYALTDCRLCAFPRSELSTMMSETPALARRMAMLSARDMAFMEQVLLATGQKNARERLTSLLLQLYVRVQALGNLIPESDEDSIKLPISQEKLGEALGITAEHVNRTLRELREEQVLEVKSKRLRVFNLNRALEIAELDTDIIEEQALL